MSIIEQNLFSDSKKIAIIQSNYIPWKGYFDIINSVDEFILYDDMQYTLLKLKADSTKKLMKLKLVIMN